MLDLAQRLPEGLPDWRADQGKVYPDVQQDVSKRQSGKI